jgi:hypothetical protein
MGGIIPVCLRMRIAQALFTEEAIRAGIRNLQMFGGVYPSGLVDEATLQVGS